MTFSVRACSTLVFASLLLPATASQGAEKPRLKVAVLTIKAENGVKQEVGNVVTEQLAAAIQGRGYAVMSPEDLSARLGFERQRQILGCTDNSCLAELGNALGVDRLVSGTIASVGRSVVINLVLLNNQSGAVDSRYSERVKDASDEAFLDLVPKAVNTLFPPEAVAGMAVAPLRVAAWVTLGAGVAAVATGAGFFAIARSAQGEVTAGNPSPYLTLQEKVAAGKVNDVVGFTALGTGGALVVTSILLFLLGPSTVPVVSVAPSAGGAVVVLGGSF